MGKERAASEIIDNERRRPRGRHSEVSLAAVVHGVRAAPRRFPIAGPVGIGDDDIDRAATAASDIRYRRQTGSRDHIIDIDIEAAQITRRRRVIAECSSLLDAPSSCTLNKFEEEGRCFLSQ